MKKFIAAPLVLIAFISIGLLISSVLLMAMPFALLEWALRQYGYNGLIMDTYPPPFRN